MRRFSFRKALSLLSSSYLILSLSPQNNFRVSVKQFPAAGRTTINWAGGTSTELFIHPSDATFAARNFLFRISTATVEVAASTFTFFEGITRHLMILKGNLELIHEGRYTKHLQPYDQDVFSGEWNTHSKGKVTDFNLMLKEGASGSLTHLHTAQNSSAHFTATTGHYFIYLASGSADFNNSNTIKNGDLLWLSNGTDLILHTLKACDWIIIEVAVKEVNDDTGEK